MIPWRRDRQPTPVFLGFPAGSAGKECTCNAGDSSSIPGLGRSPGEGKGYPLQYSGLENSMDCIVDGFTKSWMRLRDSHFHFQTPHRNGITQYLSFCVWLISPNITSPRFIHVDAGFLFTGWIIFHFHCAKVHQITISVKAQFCPNPGQLSKTLILRCLSQLT